MHGKKRIQNGSVPLLDFDYIGQKKSILLYSKKESFIYSDLVVFKKAQFAMRRRRLVLPSGELKLDFPCCWRRVRDSLLIGQGDVFRIVQNLGFYANRWQ